MSRNLLRKLNALDYSNENLHIVRNYLLNGELPETFSDYKIKRYKFLYKNFKLENGKIIYVPLNLQVIENEDKEKTLKDLYDDPNQGIGLGIQSFYDKISAKYLNIKRKEVSAFLKNQSVYQINKQEHKQVNKPIIGAYPNHRWAIDLVDMSRYAPQNRQKKIILTGIDYFSKKVFAIALPNKKEKTIVDGLEKCIEEQMGGTYPKILQADNGGEFNNKVINPWAENNDMKLIHTLSYTPTGNALVENFNKYLRKMINEGFIRYNTLNWFSHLQEYVNNRNDTKHTVTKKKPQDIWITGRDRTDFKDDENIIEVKERLEDKAKNDINRIKVATFEVGDYVRASMRTLYTEHRKILKEHEQKYLPVKFSPEIFIICKVIKPRKNIDFVSNQYLIKTKSNRIVKTEHIDKKHHVVHEPKKFFGSELQKVQEDQEEIITQKQAMKLNLYKKQNQLNV
jgi:hypothetical protein